MKKYFDYGLKACSLSVLMLLYVDAAAQYIATRNSDPRCIENGYPLPTEHYADQPYVIVCNDGSWLCTMTTSSGTEYAYMNHIVATKSYDQGKTWTALSDVETSGVPQSSWAVPLKTPSGRVYVFYNYNQNRHPGLAGVMSGPFMFKYSDDNGKTWSEKRYEVPMRKTQIDRDNFSKGRYNFFWSIDKPDVTDKAAYITFSKILLTNPEGKGFASRGEGYIMKSSNILTVINPDDIKWDMLPEADTGINNPAFGKVQEEHNSVILGNGNIYTVYRTEEGFPAYAVSRDGGKTFSQPKIMHYANGQPMGNPRACPKIHRTAEGKYLFWFHNNFRDHSYQGRNPAWLSGGIEKDGEIVWSQPEIALYDNDPEAFGMSYPDFIEQNGKMWLIETQKNKARVHPLDPDLLNGMWAQNTVKKVVREGIILDAGSEMLQSGTIPFPALPDLIKGGGFAVELWLTPGDLKAGQKILSTFGPKHKGIEVSVGDSNTIKLHIHDGEMRDSDGKFLNGQSFVSDANVLSKGKKHHIVFIVDGASKIVSIVVDGILSDGNPGGRKYGWGRVHTFMRDMNDTYKCTFDAPQEMKIHRVRVYDRYLRTSEAVANFNAGL
ncbi:LamG-like jellyroll fold domain-containing protein [Dyadobacter bucti]|uniref:LamG-like jellyroll fold domain-containing protein n=1 Tax=Dyadobacter bucti TaxID=2572203 RepID=UPI0011081A18|nr:LamG-like jellyroll fold domain-containing protein [Dyadobacter bucti]